MSVPGTPHVDLNAPPSALRDTLASACAQWGFFQVSNHGIDAQLLQSALGASEAFFRLPLNDKQALSRSEAQPWGYYDRELTKNLRDRKEIFDAGHTGDVPWPNKVAHFAPIARTFSAAAHALAVRLSVLIAQALQLPPQPAQRLMDQHSSFTRFNHYPVEDLLAGTRAPAAGPLGISHHTDAGVLTILLQDGVSGLQMQHQGQWMDVPALPGTLTVNLGDMFQVWANDHIQAPVHRVLASTTTERFSIAYFLNPAEDSVIGPLLAAESSGRARYEPIAWSEFRGLRALGDYGDYGDEVQIGHYRRE
ncbi:MAG: hypothetical protein NXI15_02995 [Gammaproteobacteria bacterium]|nr:hypothetical protein [Gammaproteobacteria bacterium]